MKTVLFLAGLLLAALLPAHAQVSFPNPVQFGTTLPATCSPGSPNPIFFLTNGGKTTGSLYECSAPNTWTMPGGGGGTVTSISSACGIATASPTTTPVLTGQELTNYQAGAYAILAGDCGEAVVSTDASAAAYTIAAAGSAGFPAGYYVDVRAGAAGTVTLTPTTSTINGAATLVLTTGQSARIISDGTNYAALLGGTVTSVICGTGLTGGTITSTGTCAIDANSQIRSFGASFDGGGSALTSGKTIYVTVPFACTITGYNITADTGTASFDIWKIATGTAIPTVTNSILTGGYLALASGTALHSTSVTLFTSTTVTANDIIGINLQAVASATELSLVILCNAT